MPDPTRPVLLFYCQHSLGIGHLIRSIALAKELAHRFRVVFLNGGPLPAGMRTPASIDRIDLPPLGMDDGHSVVSRDPQRDVVLARAERSRIIAEAVVRFSPTVVLVELFPFGRKKFAGEILMMLRVARQVTAGRARVVCSVRDILVDARRDQQHHDDRARWLADRYFHSVIVHADASLASLDESFRPTRSLRTPVYHSGYVVPARDPAERAGLRRRDHLLVSAGGGIVGGPLFECMLEAYRHMPDPPPLRLVTGPFLPQSAWNDLTARTRTMHNVQLVRQVPDMVAEMRMARASISQCGYNTALDIAVSGVPALVVPYEAPGENEQSNRAGRLADLRAVQMLPSSALQPQMLADAIGKLWQFQPKALAIDLDGARRTREIIERVCVDAGLEAWSCATS